MARGVNGYLAQIEYLALGNSAISNDGMIHIRQLHELKTLNVYMTKVGDAGLDRLSDLPIRYLYLNQSLVTDQGLASLKRLKNLHTVAVDGMQASEDGVKHIGECPSIVEVGLYGESVTDATLKRIESLSHLRQIHILNSSVTAQGIRDLKKALPHCKIVWDGGTVEPEAKDEADADEAQAVDGAKGEELRAE